MKEIVIEPHETVNYLELFKITKFQDGLIKSTKPVGYIKEEDAIYVPWGYVTATISTTQMYTDAVLNIYEKDDLEAL